MNNRKILYISVPVLVFGCIAIYMQSSNQQGDRLVKEANAQNILGQIHRSQQVHRLDHERFANSYKNNEDTGPYKYKIPIATANVTVTTAKPIDSEKIRQFVGITYRNPETYGIDFKICATKMGWFTSSTIPKFDLRILSKIIEYYVLIKWKLWNSTEIINFTHFNLRAYSQT